MRPTLLPILAALWATALPAQDAVTLLSVEAWGNFETGGVVATVAGDDDRDATALLAWRTPGGAFAPAHPLSRIDASHFAGSLFSLRSATSYEARVILVDPDGVSGSPSMAAFATRDEAETAVEPSLRTIYVDPTGDDGASGLDPESPLRTLQRAADVSQPGDLISVAPGVYRETVVVGKSGTAAQPIVFRGEPGTVLDGADATVAAGVAWTAEGGGLYSRALGFATGHVVTDLGRLFRYASLGALGGLAAGPPGGFFFDGTRLYVQLSSGLSPATRAMHVARFEDGFYLDGVSHVRIEGFEIRHFGAGDYGKGIYLRYSSDCVARHNAIHENEAAGVWIKGGARNLVEDNDVWDSSIFDWPWPSSKGSSAENNGVVLTDDVGRGHVLRRNTIDGTFNGIGPCGGDPPPGAVTTEVDVHDNILRHHTDDALEPEGYCANVRIWGNLIEDVHMAFAVAPAAPGPTYILRNVAYDFGSTRTSQLDGYLASGLKINSGFSTPIGPLYLYHNTFLTAAPSTSAMALLDPGESTLIVARNNVMSATDYALDKVNPVVLDWDYDDLYTTDPSRLVDWEGNLYGTLAELQAATGQELAGLSAPPDLVAPASGDFHPKKGSPLIDRGAVLPGINDDFVGLAPDVGAYEQTSAIFADGFESGNLSSWSASVP